MRERIVFINDFFDRIEELILLEKKGLRLCGFIDDQTGGFIRYVIQIYYRCKFKDDLGEYVKNDLGEYEKYDKYYSDVYRWDSGVSYQEYGDAANSYGEAIKESGFVLGAIMLASILHRFYNNNYLRLEKTLDMSGLPEFIKELEEYAIKNSAIIKRREREQKEKEDQEALERKLFAKKKEQERKISYAGRQKTYLMFDKATGYYKIGKSVDPKYREHVLLGMRPTIELLWTHKQNIESKLHKKFADKRIRGEWFALTQEDICEIKSLS